MINKATKTVNLRHYALNTSLIFLISCLLLSCAHNSSYVVNHRPQILDQSPIVRLDPNGDGSQVSHFLNAHKQHLSAGVCEMFWSEEGTPNDVCIVTQNGEATLIIDYTKDEYGIDGYRVSKLKHVKENKFYNHFNKNYWFLEPYDSP